MLKLALYVRLEAKPGKENELAAFLEKGLELANQETTTPLWFALRLGPSTFAIFDAFTDESGRQAHMSGPIAKALMENAPDLLAMTPVIEKVEVLGAKLPAGS
jgi:quinol monooxygenase YgiN